jgi:ABC-type branched-subunit amino acid transport system ATPase component
MLAMGQIHFDGPADTILNDPQIKEAFLGG